MSSVPFSMYSLMSKRKTNAHGHGKPPGHLGLTNTSWTGK